MDESQTIDRWPHQLRAFEDTTAAIEEGERRIVVTSPTGSGKTLMQIDLMQWALAQNWEVSVFTNRRLPLDQIKGVFQSHGIDPGMRAAGHDKAYLRSVQLCMTQTEHSQVFKRQTRDLHDAQLVIVDEPHMQKGDSMKKILDAYQEKNVPCVSYTATPLDLYPTWDYLIVAGTMSECFACGAIVPGETFNCDEPDLKHIKRYQVGQDISEPDNVKAIMRPGIVGRVFPHWMRLNPDGEPTIGFGPDVAGALSLAEGFWKKGVRAAHIDGNDVWLDGKYIGRNNEDAREHVLELHRGGHVPIIWNRYVLREAVDTKETCHIILATVFGSLSSYLQTCGRGLRSAPGKDRCIIQDHGGNSNRLGSVNSDRDWDLALTNHRAVGERQERIREKKEPEPITCPQCSRAYLPTGRGCPSCGFICERKSRVVVQIDGTLKRVEGDLFPPRRIKEKYDSANRWEKYYYSQRRAGRTFNQAYAWFFHEEHYWPPRNLPLMPQRTGDWFSKIADVPKDQLHGQEAHA